MKIGTAVLAYNRPKHFKKVLQAIIKEKVKELSVYMDGPKNLVIKKNQNKSKSHFTTKSSNFSKPSGINDYEKRKLATVSKTWIKMFL